MSPLSTERRDSERDLAVALDLLGQLQSALKERDRSKQNAIAKRLLETQAALADQWQSLAQILLRNGEIGLARQAIDHFVKERGGGPYAVYQKAALLEQAGAMREAYQLICSLPPNAPTPAAHAYSRGTAALFLGEKDDARKQLEVATRLQPSSGAAWLSLSMTGDLRSDPEIAQSISGAAKSMEAAPAAQRAAYQFALGKVRAEQEDHAAAFEAFAHGCALARSVVQYDPEADRRNAQGAVDGFSAEGIAAIASRQEGRTDRTIFVTGLPRSGTTLVEQILTSHSAVDGGAEIDRLPMLAQEIGGHSFPALAGYLERSGTEGLAQLWQHWLRERFGETGRIVDKSLTTSRYLGLAASLLPDAPIVWLTRDPLDCAWSCFRTFFEARIPWTYDLGEIAGHFILEDALLAKWRAILGDRLLVVPYEQLVTTPDEWIRRILTHCGLEEEPQVFEPHLAPRAVTTASVMQVRTPINRSSIGAAKPYREFLQPFLMAYGG